MTTAQAITQMLEDLPEDARQEVLDFVAFLRSRQPARQSDEDHEWGEFSLEAAMRGMEDEPSPYSRDDLRESFR